MERLIALFFIERSIALLELVKKCDRFLAIFDYMERAIGLVDGQGRSRVRDTGAIDGNLYQLITVKIVTFANSRSAVTKLAEF
jgi:hypothetical protein